jgi:hypothetical protein
MFNHRPIVEGGMKRRTEEDFPAQPARANVTE